MSVSPMLPVALDRKPVENPGLNPKPQSPKAYAASPGNSRYRGGAEISQLGKEFGLAQWKFTHKRVGHALNTLI